MKTIVVSDLHLTDKFEPKKYEFLYKLFNSCDQLIINGDLWCGLSVTFDKFINSPWKALFPLMLAKNAIYIYGNHDRTEYLDQRFKLFAKELKAETSLKNQEYDFVITHGHKFFRLTNPKKINLKKVLKRQKFKKPYYYLLNKFLFKTIGPKRLYKVFGFLNRKIKRFIKNNLPQGTILVTGHTHLPEFRPDRGYINTGFIIAGLAWYLEITPTSFQLQSAKY